MGRWDDSLNDQATDVSSTIIFYDFLQHSLQKSIQFIFHF